jgi:hypothetical protein
MKPCLPVSWCLLMVLLVLCGVFTAKIIDYHIKSERLVEEYADSIEINTKNDRNIRLWNTDVSCGHERYRVVGRSHGDGIRVSNRQGHTMTIYKYKDYVYVSRVTISAGQCILFVEVEGKKAGLKHVHDLIVFDLTEMRIKGRVNM